MNNFGEKFNRSLKIENVKTPEGSEVSFCPERGGIITSLKLKGKEILYLDKETLEDVKVNVKGGIPILFPNSGKIPDEIENEKLKNLKQHGFARNSKWNSKNIPNGFEENLNSGLETKEIYPYDFKLALRGSFEKDGSFTLIQSVQNTGKEEMPIASGFHPYFKVSSEEKKNIKFNFEGGEMVENQIEKWAKDEAISVPAPKSPFEISIPNLGTLVFNLSKEYRIIKIWSMKDKDFICIEPVMRENGGILTDPEKIKPGEKHVSSVNIVLKE